MYAQKFTNVNKFDNSSSTFEHSSVHVIIIMCLLKLLFDIKKFHFLNLLSMKTSFFGLNIISFGFGEHFFYSV